MNSQCACVCVCVCVRERMVGDELMPVDMDYVGSGRHNMDLDIYF